MVALDDFFTDRKAYTGSLKSALAMQSFKWFENFLKIFFFHSNSVICNLNCPFSHFTRIGTGQVEDRGNALSLVFEGIGNQVLK